MDTRFIAQIFGIFGVLLFIFSFQIMSNRKLFFVQILANVMFSIQFVLLGAYAGCVNLIICIMRNFFFMNRKKWDFVNSKWMLGVLLVLFAANTAFNWKGWFDVFTLAAVVVATLAFWIGNPRVIRTYNLFIVSPCWLIYDIAVGAWAGVLNEIIGMISIAVSILRFGWKSLGEGGDEYEK